MSEQTPKLDQSRLMAIALVILLLPMTVLTGIASGGGGQQANAQLASKFTDQLISSFSHSSAVSTGIGVNGFVSNTLGNALVIVMFRFQAFNSTGNVGPFLCISKVNLVAPANTVVPRAGDLCDNALQYLDRIDTIGGVRMVTFMANTRSFGGLTLGASYSIWSGYFASFDGVQCIEGAVNVQEASG
jgi:hypothetical protein